jgi:glycosyltransferase involved in cell wall biosynthesis
MSAKLSICMVSDDARPAATGVGTHIQQVSKELARRGHRVSILTTRRRGEPELETWEGVRLHRLFTLKVYGFYQALPSMAALRRIFQEEQADLVHHHYLGFMMKRACAVAESLALPQVSTFHFSAEVLTQPFLMRPFRESIRRQIVEYNNRCDLVIAPSQNLARQLVTDGIRTPVRYISNPVVFDDADDVTPADREPGFTVLYAGRLGPEKNLPLLLGAFQSLLRGVPDAVLWIAGQGPEREALDQQCRQLGITARVRFLGFLDHPTLARHYAACDLFVLPSVLETQGMVVMEAMWFRKPVIVTSAIVSATELVDPGGNGYIVDPVAPADLAARMQSLAGDAPLRDAMGEAGRRRAGAYRPEAVVDAVEQAYRDVLRGGAHGKAGL